MSHDTGWALAVIPLIFCLFAVAFLCERTIRRDHTGLPGDLYRDPERFDAEVAAYRTDPKDAA